MPKSLEIDEIADADVIDVTEGHTARAQWPWYGRAAGVVEQGMYAKGFPRNLGDLHSSPWKFRL